MSKTIVIFPGGFHPATKGHQYVYKTLKTAFPYAEVFVASSDNTDKRPFKFEDKQRLLGFMGVPFNNVVEVKSPYKPIEITRNYNPDEDVVIFGLSKKDHNRLSFTKQDGSPGYFQKYKRGMEFETFGKHAYVYITPAISWKFQGKLISSATEIRNAYETGDESKRNSIIQELYPNNMEDAKEIFERTFSKDINEEFNTSGYKYFGIIDKNGKNHIGAASHRGHHHLASEKKIDLNYVRWYIQEISGRTEFYAGVGGPINAMQLNKLREVVQDFKYADYFYFEYDDPKNGFITKEIESASASSFINTLGGLNTLKEEKEFDYYMSGWITDTGKVINGNHADIARKHGFVKRKDPLAADWVRFFLTKEYGKYAMYYDFVHPGKCLGNIRNHIKANIETIDEIKLYAPHLSRFTEKKVMDWFDNLKGKEYSTEIKEEFLPSKEDLSDALEVLKDWGYNTGVSSGIQSIESIFTKSVTNGKLEDIDINILKIHHDYGRVPTDGQQSIPIIVGKLRDGKYVVLDGQHRIIQAKKNNSSTVKAFVINLPIGYSKFQKKYQYIDEEILDEGPNDPDNYKALIIVGAPGSGKTTISKKFAAPNTGLTYLNIDDFYEMLKNGKEFTSNSEDPEYQKSIELIKKKKEYMLATGRGIILDRTGRNAQRIMKNIEELQALGYDVAMVYVMADEETAVKRQDSRNRKVDNLFIKTSHLNIVANQKVFQDKLKDQFVTFDNSGMTLDVNNPEKFQGPRKGQSLFKWVREWLSKKQIKEEKIVNPKKPVKTGIASLIKKNCSNWIDIYNKT